MVEIILSIIISYIIVYVIKDDKPTSIKIRESKKNNTPIEDNKVKFIRVLIKTTIIIYILSFVSTYINKTL
jgi:heme/copper-type cytochrome/quinol oxidase subunit 2